MQMMSDPRLSTGLSRVRARFVAELQERHARLTLLRAQLEDSTTGAAALTEIGQISHKIAGTAATLGFPDLGAQAAQIDELVAKVMRAPETMPQDIFEQIDRMIATASAAIQTQRRDINASN